MKINMSETGFPPEFERRISELETYAVCHHMGPHWVDFAQAVIFSLSE